jgi:hypothetical protein
MAKLGAVDIALELLQEMSDCSKHKQQFTMEAMQKVADHTNLKLCEGAQFSQVNSMASALMVETHTMEGYQPLCSVTSMQVELDLGQGTGGVSHADYASAGAGPGSCHIWGDGFHW